MLETERSDQAVPDQVANEVSQSQRIDKWLWCARFFKTRTLASKFCLSGKMRINADHMTKAHALVRPGDVLTFPLGDHVRVIEILATAPRRGPAPEARTLYTDLDPPQPKSKTDLLTKPARAGVREKGAGRPTKRERRAIDALLDPTDTA